MDLNPPFMLPTEGLRSPDTDPSVLEQSRRVLEQAVQTTQVREPEPNLVPLPGGIRINGQWITEARVRELNGYDEEELGKAALTGLPEKALDALLRAGVTHLGDHPATPALLDELISGDGNALVVAIRMATYGKYVEFDLLRCPHCREELTVKYNLIDVPSSTLKTGSNEFEVPLRNGRKAKVRMVTRGDEKALLAAARVSELSRPQQETILMARCVLSITGPDGTQEINGDENKIRLLSMPDRHAIVRELEDRHIGPRFDDAAVTCTDCGGSVEVPLSIDTLFRG